MEMKVDLHRLSSNDAYEVLMQKIDEALDKDIYLIEVIHGYNRGDILKTMVLSLSETNHWAILRTRPKLGNSGTTYIELKMPLF